MVRKRLLGTDVCMDEEVKAKFPKKFCDYWWEKPKTWNTNKTTECCICLEPISKGDEYFEIDLHDKSEVKRGHLHHLEYAEVIEWIPKEPTQ